RRIKQSPPETARMSDGAYFYILRCSDGSYYTGITQRPVEERVSEHNHGFHGGYTAKRRPVTLAFADHFDRSTDAIAFERQVKGWSRAKKEVLIRGDFAALPNLARRLGTRRSDP